MMISKAVLSCLMQFLIASSLLFRLHDATTSTSTSTSVLEMRSTYIVHMDKTLMPKVLNNHQDWYSSTIDTIKKAATSSDREDSTLSSSDSASASIVYCYDNVAHGFSAVLSPNELESLKKSPGFLSAYKDHHVIVDTTHTTDFLGLSPSTGLVPAASRHGDDIIIGVVDSGVWPESKSYRDDGMTAVPSRWKGICEEGQAFNASLCNKKLIGARFFNKGILATRPGTKIKMNSARDTNGHGTHTSSTAAGNYVEDATFFGYATGTARGVAPRAKVAVYKVLWDEGGTHADVLAGIDQAIADGVDVLSISLGFGAVPLYEDPIAIASFAAMEKGVFVSTSAGNRGPALGTLHNGIPWVLTVAAGSVDRSFTGTLTLGNGQTISGWTMFPANAFIENQPLVYNKNFSACNSTTSLSQLQTGVVLCDNTFNFRIQLNTIAGSPRVGGAIFISDDPKIFETSQFPAPGIVISPSQARAVIEYAQTDEKPTVSIKFQQTIVQGARPAPVAATYTSRGPQRNNGGILKPDIMGPGTLVLASWIPNDSTGKIGLSVGLSSNFSIISGTSMSCPHASGVAALLKSAHPEWSAAAIRSAMVTTANPLDNTLNPIRDSALRFSSSKSEDSTFGAASPLAMGAGQIDPNRALDPGLVYDATPKDYVNHLCSMNYTREQILTITRSKRYNCSSSAVDLNYPSFMSLYGTSDSSPSSLVQTFRRTVTNVGSGAATYNVRISAPRGSKITVSPKTLVFRKKHEKHRYRVTVNYKTDPNATVSFGSIVWVDQKGVHSVRSPIVISPIPI